MIQLFACTSQAELCDSFALDAVTAVLAQVNFTINPLMFVFFDAEISRVLAERLKQCRLLIGRLCCDSRCYKTEVVVLESRTDTEHNSPV